MRVLISGAGIAGPTLAWWLSRAGIKTTILEKYADNLHKGQNIDIRGAAVELLRKMGILEEVRRCNTGEEGTQVLGPDGEPIALFAAAAQGMTAEFEILRGDLVGILYNATKDDSNVTYRLGTTVTSVLSNDDQSVKVQLNNGDIEEYDLLVAADGQWSKIRKSIFDEEQVRVVDKNVYVAYFTLPRLKEDNPYWNIYHAPGSRILSTRPDPHGTTRGLVGWVPHGAAEKKAIEDVLHADRQTKEDLVRRKFSGLGWQSDRLMQGMSESSEFYFQAFQQIKMDTWSKGRVVCLGDTAWAPTPMTGMGTSLALLGSYVLAGSLSRLQEGQPITDALVAYDKAFHPFVERMQYIPGLLTTIFYPQSKAGRWALQTLLVGIKRAWSVATAVGNSHWIALATNLLSSALTSPGEKQKKLDFDLPHYPRLELR